MRKGKVNQLYLGGKKNAIYEAGDIVTENLVDNFDELVARKSLIEVDYEDGDSDEKAEAEKLAKEKEEAEKAEAENNEVVPDIEMPETTDDKPKKKSSK